MIIMFLKLLLSEDKTVKRHQTICSKLHDCKESILLSTNFKFQN